MKNNRRMRMLFAVVAMAGMLSPAIALHADPCVRETRILKTYWGAYLLNGEAICSEQFIGPRPPMQMIGQEAWACDGTYESWGVTTCTEYTIEEVICGEC